MILEKPKARQIVLDAVAEIESKGVKCTVDDILWLAHLAETHIRRNSEDILDLPVKCGRAQLYPRTIAGDLWIQDFASKWWPETTSPVMQVLCELYALAHGRDEKALQTVCTLRSARIRVRTWAAANLPVNAAEIRLALDRLSGSIEHVNVDDPDMVKDKEAGASDYGDIISTLVAAYKMPPRAFLFDLSVNEVLGLYRKIAMALGRPELADKTADGDDSFGRFRLAVKEIIRKGREAGVSNG